MYARVKERFVRVDIADPSYHRLVQNRLFDRDRAALQCTVKLRVGDRVIACSLRTESKCVDGRGHMLREHQTIPAELPDIAEIRDGAVVESQIEMRRLVRIGAIGLRN